MNSGQNGSNIIINSSSIITGLRPSPQQHNHLKLVVDKPVESIERDEPVANGSVDRHAVVDQSIVVGSDTTFAAMNADAPFDMVSANTSASEEIDPMVTQVAERQIHEGGKDESRDHRINPLNLYLTNDPERGRGLFAPRAIPAGTLVEETPVLLLSKGEWEEGKMNDTILGEYGFCWSNGGMAIALGQGKFIPNSQDDKLARLSIGSLFNHSSRPNVNFIRNTKTNTISFLTCRRVEEGEELCICYSADESKLWFIPSAQNGPSSSSKGPTAIGAPSSDDEPEDVWPHIEPDDLQDASECAEREARKMARAKRMEDQIMARTERTEKKRLLRQLRAQERALQEANAEETACRSRSVTPTSTRSGSTSESIQSPQPVMYSSTSSIGSYVMPVNPLSAETISNLPPPLHSNPTSSPNTPPDLGAAVLTPDILWRECDWYIDGMELDPKHRPAYTHDKGKWGEVHRIKGPAELEEYGEDNGTSEFRFVDVACLFS